MADSPLHALERALRPTSSRPYPLAEDVLARLIAMGWEAVPASEAQIGREMARVCRMFALEACQRRGK